MPEITLRVNGRDERAVVEGRTTLAELLRDHLGLTGTHLGCEHGVCAVRAQWRSTVSPSVPA